MGLISYGDAEIHGVVGLHKGTSVTSLGHHVAALSPDGHLHFHAHNEFDGEICTEDGHMTNAYSYTERFILQSDNSGTWTGTLLEYVITSPYHILSNKVYNQTDSTAATEPVRIRMYQGTDDTGALIFDQTYLASNFPASSEIERMQDGYVEYDEAEDYFIKYSSDANFSLKMNSANAAPWTAADVSILREESLLQTKPWVSGDTWNSDDYFIDSRKIYICNTTGVQSGTFSSNAALWDSVGDTGDHYWSRSGIELSPSTSGDNIFTDGWIGIGIAPYRPLHVKHSVQNELVMRVQSDVMNGGGWHGIGLSGENQNVKGGILWQSNSTQYSRGNIVFALNSELNQNDVTISDEKMRITDDGYVGINNSSPSAKLDIVGNLNILDANDESALTIVSNSTTYPAVNILTDSTTGNSSFRVISSSADTSARSVVEFSNTDASSENAVVLFLQQSSAALALQVQGDVNITGDLTVDTTTLFVDSDNNKVGFGTITPDAIVDIHSTSDTQLRLSYDTSSFHSFDISSNGSMIWSPRGANADISIDFTSATDGDFFINTNLLFADTSANNVGIRTSNPLQALDVDGNIDLRNGSLFHGVFGDQTVNVLNIDFSEIHSSTQYDKSEQSNDSVLQGSANVADGFGKYGNGVTLNGTTDYVLIESPSGLPGSNSIRTFEALVYADAVGPGSFPIFSYGAHVGTNIFAIERTLTSLRVFTLGDSVSSASGVFSANTWHLVQVTYNGTQVNAWVDGVQVITDDTLSVTTNASTDAYIGRDVAGTSYWNGDIDFVRMYARVLDDDELRTHYLRTMSQGSVVRAQSFKVIDPDDDLLSLEVNSVGASVNSLYQPVYGDDTGLILDLPFKEIGSVTQYDRSQLGGTATLMLGAVATSTGGKYGSGVYLDGSGDYVKLPTDIFGTFSNGITMEIWTYPTAVQSYARFFDIAEGSNQDNIIFARMGETDDVFVQVFQGSTGGTNVIATDVLELNVWQHFIATIDSSGNVIIYKNGVAIQTGTTTSIPSATRTSNHIGRSNFGADDFYIGNFANAKIYERVLSPDEAKSHYLRGNNTDSMSVIKSDSFKVVDTSNNVNLTVANSGTEITGTLKITALPTSDPVDAGALWVDSSVGYVVKISQG